MDDLLLEYREILAEYETAVTELTMNMKPTDGIFGLGKHPGDAACHEIMDKKIQTLCDRVADEQEKSEEAAVLSEAILQQESQWTGPDFARLMLIAIQRHTLKLIPMLSEEKRFELGAWYHRQYPRRKKLPVQFQIDKALRENGSL